MTILLAVALVFNVPAALQRAIPDYTGSLQDKVGGQEQIREQLNLGGLVNEQNAQLSNCSDGAAELESCGPAPDITGITAWLNTPDGQPVDLKSLRGKVILIDFWAYSCINCQRAAPHINGWYRAYHDAGLEVIGIHTPEYAFEKVRTPETYLSVGKMVNYRGIGTYDQGSRDYTYPPSLPDDSFALRGRWSLDYQGATAESSSSTIALNYHAKDIYLVVGGTGAVAVTRDGVTETVQVNGPPTAHQIVAADDVRRGHLDVRPDPGLQVFSFTYG